LASGETKAQMAAAAKHALESIRSIG
jgi:hypothetical protein